MRIGINLLPYSPHGQGGAEVYIRNLLVALTHLPEQLEYVLFMNPLGAATYELPGIVQRVIVPVSRDSQGLRALVEQTALPILERRYRLDVLFSNYVIPFSPGGSARIVNVHDMLYREYPGYLPRSKRWWWRLAIPLSIRRSSVVLTVSHHSAQAISQAFPSAASKLVVQSEGVDGALARQQPDARSITTTLASHQIRRPFILSTGGFGPQKNVHRLLRAFQQVRRACPEVTLVLTGRSTPFVSTVNPSLLDGVVFPGFLDCSALADLYSAAEVCVLASVYEGYGLPVLEAQFFGCPVAVADIGAPGEVGGDAVETFDPWNIDSIASCLTGLLASSERRRRASARGRENLSRYSWQQAARTFVESCQLAVKSR